MIPYLYGTERVYSYDQLLEALGFLGDEYEKVIEIFTRRVAQRYGICTSTSYFDCTNFYFEIDKETAFQKKGPSKEIAVILSLAWAYCLMPTASRSE